LQGKCLLLNKSQVLDNAQGLQHKRIGLSDRTAAASSPAKYEPSPFAAVRAVLTEHVRNILAVMTRFTMERTHENSDDKNDDNGGRRDTKNKIQKVVTFINCC
jgi:hypothetical protein